MGNHHHEDERYKKYYDRTPHGEVPSDERMRLATADGSDPIQEPALESGNPETPQSSVNK